MEAFDPAESALDPAESDLVARRCRPDPCKQDTLASKQDTLASKQDTLARRGGSRNARAALAPAA
jgi:hypothetical protein